MSDTDERHRHDWRQLGDAIWRCDSCGDTAQTDPDIRAELIQLLVHSADGPISETDATLKRWRLTPVEDDTPRLLCGNAFPRDATWAT